MRGMKMSETKTNAELADEYNASRELSGFDLDQPEPVTVKRAVMISVRFSDEEIADLRDRADEAGVKVTSFIRAAALEAVSPVDLGKLTQLAQDLEQRAHDVATLASRGVA